MNITTLSLKKCSSGTPAASQNDDKIEIILTQLRERQIAIERIETYSQQEKAAGKEKELREAESKALQQTVLTESDINIQVQSNVGKAEYQRSLQEAAKIKAIAEAEAEKEARVGIGRAIAIEEQVKAYGGPQYQVVQDVMTKFTSAVAASKIDIVPKTVLSMGGREGQGSSINAFEMLLNLLVSEKLGVTFEQGGKAEDARVKEIKESIMKAMTNEAGQPASVPEEASRDA